MSTANKKNSKANLVIAIQALLEKNAIGTQEEISQALSKQGFKVNQVMISRLLHKIGAVRITEGEQTVYRLSSELGTMTPQDTLKHLVLNVKHNQAMIVINTAPGSAQLVARLLDQKKISGILGTVAGDDTIFVAPEKMSEIQQLTKKIYTLLTSA